jgi:hypothetical protein
MYSEAMTTTTILDEYGDPIECIDDPDFCSGAVEYRAVPGGTAVPRCVAHFDARLARYEDPNSLERYADSDVAPAWFDPSIAGERWDDDY